MQFFSDFSDTIAVSSTMEKFPPFELELGKIVVSDPALKLVNKTVFLAENQKAYEEFQKIRRNHLIPYNERMKVWLSPFKNILKIQHITQLTSTFKLNPNFITAVTIVKNELNFEKLEINIISGTLWQIINSFLLREDVKKITDRENIFFINNTVKLIFENGVFNGELEEGNELNYASSEDYPKDCLVFGDDNMENYSFGDKLLNVQSFNRDLITKRIRAFL